ncbi:MAG: hypothetical protein M3Y07_16760, partial [Acidobacteriota bacterium]|nr:hypothetical protein [Acidobacteriota bacterium]
LRQGGFDFRGIEFRWISRGDRRYGRREKQPGSRVASARMEQLYPFARDQVEAAPRRHPAAEVAWVQEEPRNMGAWGFVSDSLQPLLDATLDADGRKLRYIGRAESSSPATGSKKRHDREQAELIMQALA